jgi:hypothetical protein
VGLADMPPPYFWAEAAEANSNSSTALAANTTKIFFINHLPYLKQMPSLFMGNHLPFLLRHCGHFIELESTGPSP